MKKNNKTTTSSFISTIDKNWTLFLDRDGTINKLLVDDYVKEWNEFEFIDGVLDALPILKETFNLIIIVTNQQGIGKKIMSEKALRSIHVKMMEMITENGGYIDEIYYCPHLEEEQSPLRKPYPGMGLAAKSDFPEIDFRKSVMVGDSLSDMQFGKNLGAKTVLLTQYQAHVTDELKAISDLICYDLVTFTEELIENKK